MSASVIILLAGVLMAGISAWFWTIEANAFIIKIRRMPKYKMFKSIRGGFYVITCLPALLPLIIDFAITIFLSGMFQLSTNFGFIIGLLISNIISIKILMVSKDLSGEI